jgi:microcystin-dependent protein
MSDQFVAEIRAFGFNFAPTGWAMCNGQLLPISQNTALFSLLGTTYGGDGKTNFALPNLQGSAPMHQGQGAGLSQRFLGEAGGENQVSVLASQMPAHSHPVNCNTADGNDYGPSNNVWAPDAAGNNEYAGTSNAQMSPAAISTAGGGQPHNNLQPYLVLNFCIALQGIFPPRS